MSNGNGGNFNGPQGGMAEQRFPSPSPRGVMGQPGFYGSPMVPQGGNFGGPGMNQGVYGTPMVPQGGFNDLIGQPDYPPFPVNGGVMANPGFVPGPSVPQLTDQNLNVANPVAAPINTPYTGPDLSMLPKKKVL